MAIKIGTIKQEEARCRRAFKGVKVGALVHCCHHAVHFEHLTEPWENRVNYILREKPQHERAVRLRWFRPVVKKQIAKMPPDCQKAYADWEKASADWEKASADRQKADADRQKADADRQKAYTDWQKADARELCPKGCPWNGKDIFGS